MKRSIHIGWDPREAAAFAVARHTLLRQAQTDIPIAGLVLSDLQRRGLYTRPMDWRRTNAGHLIMWDVLSDAPMSTQHACARFLVRELVREGWAMFCDGDVLFRCDVGELFDGLDPQYAVYCVKHKHVPKNAVKMDGQVQTVYPRKNWSSVFVLNCEHEANKGLTVELINTLPGRFLHAFCWIDDDELIGELDPAWNFLVGDSDPKIVPKLVHFTNGVPDMDGYQRSAYADEWWAALQDWAGGSWDTEINSLQRVSRAAHRPGGNGSLSVTAGASIGMQSPR